MKGKKIVQNIMLIVIFTLIFMNGYSKVHAEEYTFREKVEDILLGMPSKSIQGNLGPGMLDMLIKIADDNFRLARTGEGDLWLTEGAVYYLGIFKYKKAVPLLREIMNSSFDNKEVEDGFKYRSLQALIRIDCKGNRDIIEEVLNPEKTKDDLRRYTAAELLKNGQPDVAIEILKKALPQETYHTVILRIDETLAEIDNAYKNSQERKKLLLSKKPRLTDQEQKEMNKIKLSESFTEKQFQEVLRSGNNRIVNLWKYTKRYEKRIQEIEQVGKSIRE